MKTKFVIVVFSIILVSMFPLQTEANIIYETENVYIKCVDEQIVSRADVIETIVRSYYGILQYRRWNKTRGYWMDDDWIDL